jgi:hypothetical protein
MAGLGKLSDSYCSSMEYFRWVGSHNPLSFLNCRTPSTGTIRPTVCVRTTISNLEGVQMVCLVARTVSGGNRMSPEPNRWDKALRPWYRSFGK